MPNSTDGVNPRVVRGISLTELIVVQLHLCVTSNGSIDKFSELKDGCFSHHRVQVELCHLIECSALFCHLYNHSVIFLLA